MPEPRGYLDPQDRPPGPAMVVAQYVLLLPRTWWGIVVHAFLVQAWIGLPLAWCEWRGDSQIFWGMFLVVPMFLLAVSVFVRGLVALVRKRDQEGRAMVWGLFGVLAAFGLGRLRGDARDAAFAVCAVRAQPLVDAISRFEHERGRPPSRLEDLVPAFLAEVPGTGLSAYPRFELDRPGGEARTAAAWELQVRCSKSFFDFDVFFYWPTQNYPREIYGGWVERIGTWAYVHE